MFLSPDEHIIIMEDTYLNPYNEQDIKMLIDAGIKTIHVNDSVCWNELMTLGFPKFNWSSLDRKIEKYLNTDLKLLLPFFFTMPDWFNNSWYYERGKTLDQTIPNFNSPGFCAAVDDFLRELLVHCSDLKSRIQFTYAIPATGEFLWDAMLENNFPFSDGAIHKFVIDRQKSLSKQYNEIWMYFHNFLGAEQNWNNTKLPLLYQSIRDEFNNIPFYSIQFAHFACGNILTDAEKQFKVKRYTEKFNIKFFVGSEFVEGLETNFDKAIQQKVYGFITCPNMSFCPHRHVEPWMIDIIRKTNKKFEENK